MSYCLGIRLSAGLALYDSGQLQHPSTSAASGRGLPMIADQFGTSFDSVTDFLTFGMDNTKRNALKSVSRVATDLAARSAAVLSQTASTDSGGPGGLARRRFSTYRCGTRPVSRETNKIRIWRYAYQSHCAEARRRRPYRAGRRLGAVSYAPVLKVGQHYRSALRDSVAFASLPVGSSKTFLGFLYRGFL